MFCLTAWDGNEFRWYILERIAKEWGDKCERNHEGDLKNQWNAAGYGRDYDRRKAWWEYELEYLLKYTILLTRISKTILPNAKVFWED